MRDGADNVVIVCSIENLDPMGVHTGDSITVAPAMTLTDREYQLMRDCVDRDHPRGRCRGRRLQHPVRGEPGDGEQLVIEMNPRVSRSSALASKATGFPIARIGDQGGGRLPARRAAQRHHQDDPGLVRAGARLRGGEDAALRLREVPRPPIPRLTTQMKSVGEVDGHRAHLQGGVPEGAARPGDRPARLGRSARRRRTTGWPTATSRPLRGRAPDADAGADLPDQAGPAGWAIAVETSPSGRGSIPGSSASCRSWWRPSGGGPRGRQGDDRTEAEALRRDEAAGILRPAAGRSARA